MLVGSIIILKKRAGVQDSLEQVVDEVEVEQHISKEQLGRQGGRWLP